MKHISYVYTNTFKVKNNEQFQNFCAENKLVFFTSHLKQVGFWKQNDADAIIKDTSFFSLLGEQLEDDQVAIVFDVDIKCEFYSDYSPPGVYWVIAYAINNRGEINEINTEDIMLHAQLLGKHITCVQDS